MTQKEYADQQAEQQSGVDETVDDSDREARSGSRFDGATMRRMMRRFCRGDMSA